MTTDMKRDVFTGDRPDRPRDGWGTSEFARALIRACKEVSAEFCLIGCQPGCPHDKGLDEDEADSSPELKEDLAQAQHSEEMDLARAQEDEETRSSPPGSNQTNDAGGSWHVEGMLQETLYKLPHYKGMEQWNELTVAEDQRRLKEGRMMLSVALHRGSDRHWAAWMGFRGWYLGQPAGDAMADFLARAFFASFGP